MRKLTSLIGISFIVVACGGGPTGTDSGDPLSDAEVQAIFNELAAAFAGAGSGIPAASNSSGVPGLSLSRAAAVPIDGEFSHSASCSLGGVIGVSGSVSGDIDQETLAGDLAFGVTWAADGCVVQVEANTVTVDAELELDAEMSISQESFSMSGTQRGGISYTTSDDRTGSCAIDVAFDVSVEGQNITGSTTGQVCGRDASSFSTFTFGATT